MQTARGGERKWQRSELKKTNHLTARFADLSASVRDQVFFPELRKREHYEKPSVKRKKKSEAARKRKFK